MLTGQDIIAALNNNYRNQKVILPEVVFRDGQDVLLDDVSLQDIIKATGADLRTVDGTAGSLINAIIAQ